jgi:branched-chain amino acid transport system permease protein
MLYLQTALNGLVLGLIYTAMAVGLSLTMGVLGVINVAHSALMISASLLAWQMVGSFGVDPLLTVVILVPVFFGIGAGLERVLVRRVAREAETTALLVLFGVLLIVESIGILVWTTDTRVLNIGYLSGALSLGRLTVPYGRLAGATIALVAVTALHLFLSRTLTGRSIRAMAQNRDAAALVGIKVPRLTTIVFGVGTALAAIGGVSLALAFPFTPQGHIQWLAWSFLVVVMGGLGSVRNTLVAGVVLGLIESFAGILLPFEYVYLIVYALLAIALLVRSGGLLTATERRI